MTSRERMLRAIRGEKTDRVPVTTYDLSGFNPFHFCNQAPSYRSLMDYIREKTDCLCMWSPGSDELTPLSAADPGMRVVTERVERGLQTTSTIQVGPRTLTRRNLVQDGMHTVWRREYWCKDMDDVDAMLSLPYEPVSFDFQAHRPMLDALGERGIAMQSVGESAYETMTLMGFADSLEWVMGEPDHFEKSLRIVHARTMENLERLLSGPKADIYRIVGPEYMTPPYLPPSAFERFVLPGLTEMVALIHACGALVDVHSHGNVARTAPLIARSGADAMDPCEPPPDGDIDMSDLKRLVGDQLCLIGNIEARLLEGGSAEAVREATLRAMEQGKPGGHFIMGTTGGPIEAQLQPGVEARYRAYIDAALECADY